MMTISELFGQMLIVGFEGTSPEDKNVQETGKMLADGRVGGVIHFTHNVSAHLHSLNNFFLSQHPLLPLLCIDQEGGRVQRLQEIQYKTPKQVAATEPDIEAYYKKLAKELSDYGFNINFGPCVDLDLVQKKGVIGKYERSFGLVPEDIVRCANAFVSAHHAYNIKTCVKHAPGHGSAGLTGDGEADTHEGFVDVSKDWSDVELRPYSLMHEAKTIDSIMMAHTFNDRLDPKWPASLSPKTVSHMRGLIGEDAPIITDDICMGAMRQTYTFEEALVQIIVAGNDMVIISNNPAAGRGGHNWPVSIEAFVYRAHLAINTALSEGALMRHQLEESYGRIRAFKNNALFKRL